MKGDLLDRVIAARTDRVAACVVTDLGTGQQTMVALTEEGETEHGAFGLDDGLKGLVHAALRHDKSGIHEHGEGRYFLHVFNPPKRMILVGAVHIAQAMAPMAAMSGYDVTIVDPRQAFATDERFPGIEVSTDWPDEAIRDLAPDHRTAVVTLTHDPKLDDPALIETLKSRAFYVGALGSRKTHASRLERLKEAGVGEDQIARIHGPLGLDIGAVTPAEIALSALAQATAVLHEKAAAGGDRW